MLVCNMLVVIGQLCGLHIPSCLLINILPIYARLVLPTAFRCSRVGPFVLDGGRNMAPSTATLLWKLVSL